MMPGSAVAGPQSARAPRDAYMTPDALALAITKALHRAHLWLNPTRILEPGCGEGAFLRAAHATWPDAMLHGVDLSPRCEGPGNVETLDLLDVQEWGSYSLALGNPPFVDAVMFVRHCLSLVRDGGHVAFLLPLSFLGGPRSRREFWRDLPLRALAQIIPRPSFTGGGTAAQEYALMVWRKGFRGRGDILPAVVWR